MITYDPLWRTMKEKNVSTYALLNKHGIRKSTIDRFKHNMNVNIFTIEKMCKILDCDICDVVEYKKDWKNRSILFVCPISSLQNIISLHFFHNSNHKIKYLIVISYVFIASGLFFYIMQKSFFLNSQLAVQLTDKQDFHSPNIYVPLLLC